MTTDEHYPTENEIRRILDAAAAHPGMDVSGPLALSLATREGLRSNEIGNINTAEHRPAANGAPGTLSYRDGDETRTVDLSPESEVLLVLHRAG